MGEERLAFEKSCRRFSGLLSSQRSLLSLPSTGLGGSFSCVLESRREGRIAVEQMRDWERKKGKFQTRIQAKKRRLSSRRKDLICREEVGEAGLDLGRGDPSSLMEDKLGRSAPRVCIMPPGAGQGRAGSR